MKMLAVDNVTGYCTTCGNAWTYWFKRHQSYFTFELTQVTQKIIYGITNPFIFTIELTQVTQKVIHAITNPFIFTIALTQVTQKIIYAVTDAPILLLS